MFKHAIVVPNYIIYPQTTYFLHNKGVLACLYVAPPTDKSFTPKQIFTQRYRCVRSRVLPRRKCTEYLRHPQAPGHEQGIVCAMSIYYPNLYSKVVPTAQEADPCPERDLDGYCHCKKEDHPRIIPVREPNYPLKGR